MKLFQKKSYKIINENDDLTYQEKYIYKRCINYLVKNYSNYTHDYKGDLVFNWIVNTICEDYFRIDLFNTLYIITNEKRYLNVVKIYEYKINNSL